MKIVFIGAHGTGKSTLATDLQRCLSKIKSFPLIESVARQCRSALKSNDIYKILDDNAQDKMKQEMITDFAFWDFERICSWNIDCIMTRCPLDVVAYEIVNYGHNEGVLKNLSKLFDFKFKGYFNNCIFFYIPIEFDLVDDGIRPMGKEYQKKVDKAMLDLVNNLDLPIITITGDKQERLNKCIDVLLFKVFGR